MGATRLEIVILQPPNQVSILAHNSSQHQIIGLLFPDAISGKLL